MRSKWSDAPIRSLNHMVYSYIVPLIAINIFVILYEVFLG